MQNQQIFKWYAKVVLGNTQLHQREKDKRGIKAKKTI